jgi:hypothetical protein
VFALVFNMERASDGDCITLSALQEKQKLPLPTGPQIDNFELAYPQSKAQASLQPSAGFSPVFGLICCADRREFIIRFAPCILPSTAPKLAMYHFLLMDFPLPSNQHQATPLTDLPRLRSSL